jgi:hypothetical protein
MVPTLRLNDLLKTHTDFSDSALSTTSFVLAINKPAYERLPRDLKTVLDNNSGQVAAAMAGAMWDAQAAAVADTAIQRGDPIVTLLPEAVAHWRKATQPVVDAWLKAMKEQKIDGGKLLAGAHALVAKYANAPESQVSQSTAPSDREAVAQPQPQAKQPQAKQPQANTPAAPNGDAAAAARPAPVRAPTAVAKPAPPAAPAPHVATQAPVPAPSMPVTASVPVPAPATPVVKPVPAPAPTGAAAPPVATPAPPAPTPPLPKPLPAAAPPPKTLDIPL